MPDNIPKPKRITGYVFLGKYSSVVVKFLRCSDGNFFYEADFPENSNRLRVMVNRATDATIGRLMNMGPSVLVSHLPFTGARLSNSDGYTLEIYGDAS